MRYFSYPECCLILVANVMAAAFLIFDELAAAVAIIALVDIVVICRVCGVL